MELGDVTGEGPKTEPKLVMHKLGDILAPKAPVDLNAIGSEKNTLIELAVKLAGTVARFNTEWVAKEMRLSLPLVRTLLERLDSQRRAVADVVWPNDEKNGFKTLGSCGLEEYRQKKKPLVFPKDGDEKKK